MYALEEPLNVKFLDLARRCQAVLCCRATPLQKVSTVRMFLWVVTLLNCPLARNRKSWKINGVFNVKFLVERF